MTEVSREESRMLQRPSFQPHIHVENVEGEGVFLLWETGQALLQGRLYQLIAPLVDGRRSSDQIVDALEGQVSAPQVYFALQQLAGRGYLLESDDGLDPGLAALWSIQGLNASTAARRLAAGRVAARVVGAGVEEHLDSFRQTLETAGLRLDPDGDLDLVLTDDYLREGLRAVNDQALERRRPWLLARPVGCTIWLGPLFVPGQTACWECLALRLRANRPTDSYVVARQPGLVEPPPLARAAVHAGLHIAWNMLASEASSFLVRGDLPDRRGSILTLDTLGWKSERHAVTRVWHCAACGDGTPSSRPGEPLVLTSQRKTFTRDGGHRVVSPQVTLERLAHHISPLTGIITDLTRCAPSADGVLHVYSSGQHLGAAFEDLTDLRRGLRSGKSGKGASDLQARASALCEGLERHSGTFRGDEPRRLARQRDLGDSAIAPNSCLLFSERQFRERERWNRRDTRYNLVSAPLSPDAEISWTPVWSLTRRETRHLPTALSYYQYVDPGVEPFAIACSNGNAAGNTVEEAVLQGFFEVVERDSVALWWYNRVRRPGIDLDSFGEPYLKEVRTALGRMNRDLWAVDLTADLGVPVFAAFSRRQDRGPERILIGFGAHLDARIALLRAVTEVSQMLSWVSPMESDPPQALEDAETMSWLRTATIASEPYLLPDPAQPLRRASDYQRPSSDDLRDDVLHCQSLVERRGLEMLVLDQSRKDVGLSVVKVFVPGLRHFWARFAPGRLYDVPVQLGWRTEPLGEDQLNPVPFFI
jgi:bacteriocin biosynthesis cyclodehydratase domain-containing protein